MTAAVAEPKADGTGLPAGATQQLSYSGTPRNSQGYTRPDEYVRELAEPIKRMQVFEEMGNDDAVHTALDARRQETASANWHLASEDTTPRGQEILEFVEDNVYPIIDDLLRWLTTGALQYGFGAIEPVFAWSDKPLVSALARGKLRRATLTGQRRIYIRRLAHIRQTAIFTFRIADTGEFQQLHQRVFNGNQYRQVDIPAEKLLLWTYNRQGDDYWGVPPTRHCYKAWTFKTQLERLNLLSFDRFGVGVPVAEEGVGWSQAERDRLALYLKAFRSGDSSYVIHPQGGAITILSGDGKMTMSGLEWVKYYNFAIAKVFLTQQTELGSTQTGARAVAETFYEQLGSIVQADCEELAGLINNQLIVPLVQANYGPQENYPTFAPSQRVRAGSGVASVVGTLMGQGVIHARPEDEAYFRDVFELPAVELQTLKDEDTARKPAPAGPGDPPAPGAPPEERIVPLPPRPARGKEMLGAWAQTAAGGPAPAAPGQTTYRTPEYSTWEYGILRPDALGPALDLQSSRLAGEVHDLLQQVDADLAAQVDRLAKSGPSALAAAVRAIAVPDRLRTQLRKILLAAAGRARVFGAQAVQNEIERLLGPSAIGPQRSPGLLARALATADGGSIEDMRVSAEVDRAVEDELDRREQAARGAVLAAIAQAAGAAAPELAAVAAASIKSALVDLSTGRTAQNVSHVVNTGFGVGRTEQAAAIVDDASGSGGNTQSGLRDASGAPIDLTHKIYSAVMDEGTCDECAKWDGAEFPIDYPEDYTGVQAPNPRCAGTYAQCRCVWIYVTSHEAAPTVPTSKGPLPIRRAA